MTNMHLIPFRVLRGGVVAALLLMAVATVVNAASAFGQSTTDAATVLQQLEQQDARVAANVTAFTTYTSASDPERLLGTQHQYDSKVTFADRRVAPAGGSIEVFQTPADLAARVAHLQRSQQSLPHEYYYGVGTILLRLSGNLPPEVAAVYGAALRDITTQR